MARATRKSNEKRKEKRMKEKILDSLKNVHEAKTLIEINDLLNLTTVEEYQELQKNIEELVSEYKIFITNKQKNLLMKNFP